MLETGPLPAEERSAQSATLTSPVVPPRHATLLDALESGAQLAAPGFTFHAGMETQRAPLRSVRDGSAHVARVLQAEGLARGEIVPLLLPTSEHLLHAFLGVIMAGGVPAPLATPMTFGSPDRFIDRLCAMVRETRAVRAFVAPRLAETVGADARVQRLGLRVLTEAAVVASTPKRRLVLPSLGAEDLAFVQYTSGTTGTPRGVCISHGAITHNAAAIHHALGITDADVGVSWLPMHHDMGLVGAFLSAVCHPYEVHLLRPEAFVMKPGRWLELLDRTRATVTVAPNFAYELAVQRTRPDAELHLGRLRIALSGAEPVRAETVARFTARFGENGLRDRVITPVYGMAEATLAITAHTVGTPIKTENLDRGSLEAGAPIAAVQASRGASVVSVGKPVPGVSLRLRTPSGHGAAEGTLGEVLVQSPSQMAGYYARPEETAACQSNGWLQTGDLGFVRGGELYLTGRAKELIIIGGKNYAPLEIEQLSETAARASGAAAFSVPDDEGGTEALAVVVEARASAREDKARIAKDVRAELLATLGVAPSVVAVVPIGRMPRTTSGKVQRRACHALLTEEFMS